MQNLLTLSANFSADWHPKIKIFPDVTARKQQNSLRISPANRRQVHRNNVFRSLATTGQK